MMRIAAAICVAMIAAPVHADGVAGGSRGLARPQTNILLITMDDIGREWVNDYNPEGDDGPGGDAGAPDDMPNLSTLADEGVRMNWVAAAVACGPTRAALFSGRYWTRTGSIDNSGNYYDAQQETPIPAMLELSWPGWYWTANFGEHGLGAGEPLGPGRMGFRYSWAIPGPFIADKTSWGYRETSATSRADGDITSLSNGTLSTEPSGEFVDRFSAWLTANSVLTSGRPFFVHVGFEAPHIPIYDPDNSNAACPGTEAACFVAMRQALDTAIGDALALLPADVMAKTLVIVVSDNGTDWQSTGAALPDHTYCGGKGSLCEDGAGVIAIVGGGVVANGGRVDDQPRSIVDVMTTVLDYAHAHATPTLAPDDPSDDRYNGQPYVLDGLSWRDAISQDCPTGAPCDAVHDVVFYAAGNATAFPFPVNPDYAGITSDRWKFFGYGDGSEYLYELTESVFAESVDPDECGLDGDCSELTGTPLAKADAVRAARTALDAASP